MSDDLYPQIQQFYGYQMQLLDDGNVDEWAATFTEDGVFAADAHPEPTAGRAAIAAAARAATEALIREGVQRRHWLGMLSIGDHDANTARVRSYALVIATPRGGKPAPHVSTTCDDVLVRHNGSWLVRERRVRRDDLVQSLS